MWSLKPQRLRQLLEAQALLRGEPVASFLFAAFKLCSSRNLSFHGATPHLPSSNPSPHRVLDYSAWVSLDTSCRVAMFRNTFQSGFLSILYSIGSKPLQVRRPGFSLSFHWSSTLSTFSTPDQTNARSGTRRCVMATSSASRTRTSRAPCSRSWGPTSPPTT